MRMRDLEVTLNSDGRTPDFDLILVVGKKSGIVVVNDSEGKYGLHGKILSPMATYTTTE